MGWPSTTTHQAWSNMASKAGGLWPYKEAGWATVNKVMGMLSPLLQSTYTRHTHTAPVTLTEYTPAPSHHSLAMMDRFSYKCEDISGTQFFSRNLSLFLFNPFRPSSTSEKVFPETHFNPFFIFGNKWESITRIDLYVLFLKSFHAFMGNSS